MTTDGWGAIRRWGWLLLAGVVARAAALPQPGTLDVPDWKATSFVASSDFVNIYGHGGSPPEERQLVWDGVSVTTEYPPISHGELAIVGLIYRRLVPDFRDSAMLSVLIKLPGMLAEIAFLVVIWSWAARFIGQDAASWAALAFWVSPSIWIAGSVLGYLDAQMAVPATFAVLAATANRASLAGALAGVAILTKPQAVFVVPVMAVVLARQRPSSNRWPSLSRAAVAGALVTLCAVLPFIAAGSWPSMLRAFERLGEHDIVSGTSANVWWAVSWLAGGLARWHDLSVWELLTRPATSVRISTVTALGLPNPRLIGTVLAGAALVWAAWRTRRATDVGAQCLIAAWSVMAYFMLAGQVHENHSYLALPLLAIAAGVDRSLRTLYVASSATVFLNLYMFYGLGTDHAAAFDRQVTVVDASLLLTAANVVLFAWWTMAVSRRTSVRSPLVVSVPPVPVSARSTHTAARTRPVETDRD